MPSINDLKVNNEDTGTGIANADIMSITNPNASKSNEENSDKSKRVIADLSSLPKAELHGVDIKEGGIEDEIFKNGGEFDTYIGNKKAEMEAVCELIDQHNESIAASRGEEVPDNDSIDNKDMTAILAGTKYDSPYYAKANIEKVKKAAAEDSTAVVSGAINKENNEEYVDPVELELEALESGNNTAPKEQVKYVVAKNDNNNDIKPIKEQMQKNKDYHDNLESAISSVDLTNKDISFDIDDSDIDELFEENKKEDTTEADSEANFKELQASITEKIKPVNDKLDISSFKVVSSPLQFSSSILQEQLNDYHEAEWALMNSKMHIGMKEFRGKEIEKLGSNDGANRFTIMKNRYKLIFDHLTGNKPDSLEAWLKSVSFLDNDHLYFAIYMANFADANYIPYDCPHCHMTFLSENIEMSKMYTFKDKDAEDKFDKIRNSQIGLAPGLYTSEIVPISSKFAIGFRDPSIYSIVMETALLDEKFATKYQDIISIISYIDNVYKIDMDTQQITPIGYKMDANNMVNTTKAKIITYAKIIASFSPDQYNTLIAYMNAINIKSNDITYKMPEVTCPHCKQQIAEQVSNASDLVFMRAQLAMLGLTSIN